LDEFYIFQLAGYIGIILILKTIAEVAPNLSGWRRLVFPAVAFSPGLHFWTVALGKDGLGVLSLGLICAGLDRKVMNKPLVGLGLFVLFVVRPHIALLEAAALVVSVAILSRRATSAVRMTALSVGTVALVAGAAFMIEFLGLEGGGLDEFTNLLDKYQTGNQLANSVFDTTGLIFPLRMAVNLLLPLYFDATNINSFVLSVDDTFTLFFLIYSLLNIKRLWEASRSSYIVGFGAPAFLFVLVFLTAACSNIGLATREKMMIVPLLAIVFSVLSESEESHTGKLRPRLFGAPAPEPLSRKNITAGVARFSRGERNRLDASGVK